MTRIKRKFNIEDNADPVPNFQFNFRDPEKNYPDPGSRVKKGTGSRIRIRNTDSL
jgi:hypothetical protein